MSWDSVEKNLDAGPRAAGWLIFKWALALMMGVFLLGLVGHGLGWFGEAAQVAQEQFGPRALLQKYEWFKNAAAQLDKLNADIRVYEARVAAIEKTYEGVPRTQWARDDRQDWSIASAELAGVKAAYNELAAEYNAQMAKFNYAFTNAGQLPQGADRVLPREFRTYEVK